MRRIRQWIRGEEAIDLNQQQNRKIINAREERKETRQTKLEEYFKSTRTYTTT